MLYNAILDIAQRAHAGQVRWDGTEYINHPIAVEKIAVEIAKKMTHLEQFIENCRIVSIAHDVVEDHPEYYEELSLNTTSEQMKSILLLTRDKNISYLDYLLPIRNDLIATVVKRADLIHNLSCFPPEKRNKSLYDKYKLALYILEN